MLTYVNKIQLKEFLNHQLQILFFLSVTLISTLKQIYKLINILSFITLKL